MTVRRWAVRRVVAFGVVIGAFTPLPGTAGAAAVVNVPSQAPTIQAAIDAASSGDTIVVAPGTYFENVDFHGKNVSVVSSAGAGQTVIDGRGVGPVVSFSNGETNQAVLHGFTLQHGVPDLAHNYAGGGVAILYSSPTVEQNYILDNVGSGSGLGVGVTNGAPVIRSNVIEGNHNTICVNCMGGGIYVSYNTTGGRVQITGNWIQDNSNYQGGGIASNGGGVMDVVGNVVVANRAQYDGGGYYEVNDTSPVLVQNWIVQNVAEEGTGLYLSPRRGSPVLLNANLVYGNLSFFGDTPTTGAAIFEDLAFIYLANNGIASEPDHTVLRCADYPFPPGLVSFFGGNKLVPGGAGATLENCARIVGTP